MSGTWRPPTYAEVVARFPDERGTVERCIADDWRDEEIVEGMVEWEESIAIDGVLYVNPHRSSYWRRRLAEKVAEIRRSVAHSEMAAPSDSLLPRRPGAPKGSGRKIESLAWLAEQVRAYERGVGRRVTEGEFAHGSGPRLRTIQNFLRSDEGGHQSWDQFHRSILGD